MTFDIELAASAKAEIRSLRAYDRRWIVEEIEKQLRHQPNVETRNREKLDLLLADFEHQAPLWEIRVGEHRVFYDIDESLPRVTVRAVRRKRPEQTTEEVVDEDRNT